jgi:multidrug efflux pump subunit AcrA (membrane-fusion protein)
MFGRMMIPSGEREQLLVPADAVRSVGQLEMVKVVVDDAARASGARTVERRFVRTGATLGDRIEILSGLKPGETVLASFGDA